MIKENRENYWMLNWLIKALRELDDKQVELSESLYNGMD